MPEFQPWRNPRPAPHLPEIQARLRPPRMPSWLRAWWPALLWAGFIFSMSTDTFSTEHTALVFEPILRWMVRSLTEYQFLTIHFFIRKSAHFTEYFVFCLLLYRHLGLCGCGSADGGPYAAWKLRQATLLPLDAPFRGAPFTKEPRQTKSPFRFAGTGR